MNQLKIKIISIAYIMILIIMYNDPNVRCQRTVQNSICVDTVLFIENASQKFGFDENKISWYPTYETPLGAGVPWKSLGNECGGYCRCDYWTQFYAIRSKIP
jgi:hypothetical protein